MVGGRHEKTVTVHCEGPNCLCRPVQPCVGEFLVSYSNERKIRVVVDPYFIFSRHIESVAIIDGGSPLDCAMSTQYRRRGCPCSVRQTNPECSSSPPE